MGTHDMSPLRVGLGRPQRLAGRRHVQDVGVQLGRHGGLEGARRWDVRRRRRRRGVKYLEMDGKQQEKRGDGVELVED